MSSEKIICPDCNGVGGFPVEPKNPTEKPGWRTCRRCNGTGNATK